MWESSSPLISPRTLEARDKRTRARVHQREGHQQRFAFGGFDSSAEWLRIN